MAPCSAPVLVVMLGQRTAQLVGLTIALVLVASAPPSASALENGLARKPPMGFNNWNAFGCNVTERLIKETADYFVSSGMKDVGYEYVNIDDCWMTHERDAQGRLVPDPEKFPHGIKGTADYVHAKGLKLGIYEDAGTSTCAGYPGSLGHEDVDAQTFAAWGVDYLKYDNCHNNDRVTKAQYIERYSAMRDALAATGRPIVFSICEWGMSEPWTWAPEVGNLWRTTGDITDNWDRLKSIVLQNAPLAGSAKPGAWNDPDMLEIGNGGMTGTEYRSHFSLWAIMAAPLLAGTDLRVATPETMAIYLNEDVIAVDQDPLGAQGRVVESDGTHLVFARPLANGDAAVALFNGGDAPAVMSVTAARAGLQKAPAYSLHDLWSKTVTETAGSITAEVPAHGTVIYRISGLGRSNASSPRAPAKLRVLRASVESGALEMLVTITSRAAVPGAKLALTYRSSGDALISSAPITATSTARRGPRARSAETRLSIRRPLPPGLRSQNTGIVELTYRGSPRVWPDKVRLRVAPVKALLKRRRAMITNGHLIVAGTIAPEARGVVRVRLGYNTDATIRFLSGDARITDGVWKLDRELPAEATGGGVLSIQYTGYLPRKLRGEQAPVQMLG